MRIANPSGDINTTTGWTEEYDTAYYATPPADVVAIGTCPEFSCFREASAATDAMSQLVDLPVAFTACIDANARRLDLRWLQQELTEDGRISVEVTFLDAANAPLGLTRTSPLVSSTRQETAR